MILIGDIHGDFNAYKQIIKNSGAKKSIQLGDFGIGFRVPLEKNPDIYLNDKTIYSSDYTYLDIDFATDTISKHLFIRGNHDNPDVCRKHPNYLGDYGCLKGKFINGKYNKIFFISGGFSIDFMFRLEGISWWREEEINPIYYDKILNLYEKKKPDIVISHECPLSVVEYVTNFNYIIKTKTNQLYQALLELHAPSYWIFAHFHKSFRKKINETNFICVDQYTYIDLETLGGNYES